MQSKNELPTINSISSIEEEVQKDTNVSLKINTISIKNLKNGLKSIDEL